MTLVRSSPSGKLIDTGNGGGITYVVGPAGTGAPFTSIQAAIDDAEANLTPVTIFVLADTYTENLTISQPGINITGFTDRAKAQTQLVGNITYNLSGDGELALQQMDVDGQLIIMGAATTQLYLVAVEVIASSANGTIDNVNSSTSSTVIVEGNVRVTNNGAGPAYRATNGARFDGENCRLLASSTSNSSVVTNGAFIARNIETTGAIVYTGTAAFGLSMSGAATSLTANAAVIDLTGTTAPSIITNARMTSITNVNVFAGATPAKLTFGSIQTFVGFGLFDTTQGTRVASDGIVFKSGGAVTGNFLNENGTYSPAIPLATMQPVTVAGPTAIIATNNTHVRANFGGAVTLTLPAPSLGRMVRVVDASGAASAINTITTTGGTINGVSVISAPSGSLTFICVDVGLDLWDSV